MEEVAALQKTKIKGKGHLDSSLLSPADWAAPQRSGWIWKEGANRKSVKHRFFILQGTKMIYFKSNEVNSKSKPIGFFILEPGSKVALMPRDAKEKPVFKWRVLTPSRTWEFTNDNEEDMKGWVRVIARIVNPELTFGMPLSSIVARCKKRGSQLDVPIVVMKLIQFLKDNDAINVEGVFRLSGDQNCIKKLKSRFNTEIDTSIIIPPETDVHVVTGTLKYFLRDMETPLIPIESNPMLRAIIGLRTPKEKIIGYKKLVESLPRENAATLQYILKYLHQISQNHTVNKMTTQNLAVVFGPCFIRSEQNAGTFQDADMQLNSVNNLVENYPLIFPTEDLITVAGPAAPTFAPPPMNPPSFTPPPGSFNKPTVPSSTNGGARSIIIGSQASNNNNAPPAFAPPSPFEAQHNAMGPEKVEEVAAPVQRTAGSRRTAVLFSGDINLALQAQLEEEAPELPVTKPPSFAPPSVPVSNITSTSEPINISSEPPIDSSSSDDEELPSSLNDSSAFVVTSLDDLECDDGSIDVSKVLSVRPTVAPPSKPKVANPGWVPVAKPHSLSISTGTSPVTSSLLAEPPAPLLTSTAPVMPLANILEQPASPIQQTAPVLPLVATPALPTVAAPPPPTSSESSDEITEWLRGLGEDYICYATTLHNEGFKTVQQLASINEEDMKELGVKMAHRKGMKAALEAIGK